MPNISIIDSHVHLWDPDRVEIPWLSNVPPINNKRDLDGYAEATVGIQVDGIVYLQVEVAPPYALIEARDLAQMVRDGTLVKAVVAWAPLEFGNKVRYFLEEINKIGPEIRGIRRIVQDEPDPDYCLQPDFVTGNRLLAEYNLTSDLCCNFRQLASVVKMVRLCPETQFIMDHIAKPDIRGGAFEPWASQMSELASLPNVVCKISGVLTEANHSGWTLDEVKPYAMHALNAFGPDRVVYGSDWPVVTLAAPYKTWVDTLDTLTEDWTDADKGKLWRENARRFYRIDA
jgi:L-fuconolactonase